MFTNQNMTEVATKNSVLEARLQDAEKLLGFYLGKVKSLGDGEFLV